MSGRAANSAALPLSWSCSASLGADSQFTVQDENGLSLLSCSFAEGRLVSHTNDFFESVPGRARPPPERWRAALEIQSASVRLHTAAGGQSDSAPWQFCTAKLFSAGFDRSFTTPIAADKPALQCEFDYLQSMLYQHLTDCCTCRLSFNAELSR